MADDFNSMLMQKEEYAIMYKNEENLWWYRGLQGVLLHYIKKLCSKDCLVLDAGCGTGKNMEILISEGFKVKGIDLSADSISFCKSRGINELKLCSICKIDYKSGIFDAVYCMDVLGILSEDLRTDAVKEFFRVLKPGGFLIINCAAFEWLRSQHDLVVSITKRFNKKEILELLQKNGFKCIKCSYRIFLMLSVVALVKLAKKINRKGGNPRSDQWMPPGMINRLLTWIQLIENKMFYKIDLPAGSSIFAVARKI